MAYKFNPFTGKLDNTGTGGGGGSPGGSNTQIQFNDSGAFGGDADLTWNKTTNVMTVTGDVNLSDGGANTTTLQTITPTQDNTISLPNDTGTVALVKGSNGQLIYNNAGAAYAGASNTSVGATGDITLSLNGAASTPPLKLTGTWFTGGTATTTKPQVLIEPAGTTSTAWSTSGTGLGVNAASGFTGNLLDLQVGGTSQFRVSSAGALNAASAIIDNGVSGRGLAVSTYAAGGTGNAGVRLNAQLSAITATLSLATQGTDRLSFNQSTITVSDAHDIAVGGTTGTKIGTATTQKLGFYNATPVVQPTAVADITTTATSGSLPTPDGTVTIADATTPTVTELLEYCVELEAKLEAALGRLRTLGLIAT